MYTCMYIYILGECITFSLAGQPLCRGIAGGGGGGGGGEEV